MGLFPSLRWRLAVWYGGVMSLALLLFGTLLYVNVRYQLTRHHDRDLKDTASGVEGVLSRQPDCNHLTPDQITALDRFSRLILVHSVDGEKRTFYRSSDLVSFQFPSKSKSGEPLGGRRERFNTLRDSTGLYRVYSKLYRSRAGRQGLINVIERLGDVEEPLGRLSLTLLLMSPVAIVGASVGGYWLAGRALAPVDEVTSAARAIESSNLSRRLPTWPTRDEIGRLVDTFNQMIGRLETSFDSMKQFTADAAHQLKTPLTTIRGTLDVMLSRYRSVEQYREALVSIGEEIDQLRLIIEDLLILARADSQRIVLEKHPIHLDRIAEDVAKSLETMAREQGVSMELECPQTVAMRGDERWLTQLVFNLVENAIKFTPSAGRVGVEAHRESGWAVLSVSDTGPGIPEESLGRIFERFYKEDGILNPRQLGGSGLGLSIAAWIADAHKGEIKASNRLGGGSLFSVRLPLD